MGFSRTKCTESLEKNALVHIKEKYFQVQAIEGQSDNKYNFVKDFTATLLLKIEHLNFVYFKSKIVSNNIMNPFVEN